MGVALEASSEEVEVQGIVLLQNRGLRRLPEWLSLGRLSLRHLNLAFNRLVSLACLGECPNLECLDVSHNGLLRLDGVDEVRTPRLRRFFAHANRLGASEDVDVVMLASIGNLTELRELWLGANLIAEASEILPFRRLQRLEVLRFSPNPALEALPIYRFLVLSILPGLSHLDDTKVTEEERSAARAAAATFDFRLKMHRLRADERQRQNGPLGDKKKSPEKSRDDISDEVIVVAEARAPTPDSSLCKKNKANKSSEETQQHREKTFTDVAESLNSNTKLRRDARRNQKDNIVEGSASAPSPQKGRSRQQRRSASPTKKEHVRGESVAVDYEEGATAIRAPGDGGVVVRYPKGAIAIASDGGCLRAFHENGSLAVVCDDAGAATVSAPDGKSALSITPKGRGFSADRSGNVQRTWAHNDDAPDNIMRFDWGGTTQRGRPRANFSQHLGVTVDPRAHLVEVYFSYRHVKCVVRQQGGLRMLPEATDLFGDTLAPGQVSHDDDEKSTRTNKKKTSRPERLSHSELIARIRDSTASLPFSS